MNLQRFLGCGLAAGWMLLPAAAWADDWPQWLGSGRDSVWRESGVVERFPTNGLPVCWRTPIGGGYSGPAVVGSRVYVTDRLRPEGTNSAGDAQGQSPSRERVLCLNDADGKILWQREHECAYNIGYPSGPRTTPLVSEGKLYALGGEGELLCLDAGTGRVIWSHELKKEYTGKMPTWGFASHPVLDGSRLLCLVGGSNSTVVAFDKDTGKELWRALNASEAGYSSPILFQAGGKRQLVVHHPDGAAGLDPATGAEFWSVPFKTQFGLSVVPPCKQGDYLLFSTFFNGSLMLRLDSASPAVTTLWRTEKTSEKETTHLNAMLCIPFLEDGYVYGVCSYGQLRCLKAETGERVWESLQPTTSGEPVRWANAFLVKNGSRFFLFNEKGDLIVAKLSPRGYEEISRTHILEPTNTEPGRPVVWSHPAFAHRRVYARNDKEIVCLDLAQKR